MGLIKNIKDLFRIMKGSPNGLNEFASLNKARTAFHQSRSQFVTHFNKQEWKEQAWKDELSRHAKHFKSSATSLLSLHEKRVLIENIERMEKQAVEHYIQAMDFLIGALSTTVTEEIQTHYKQCLDQLAMAQEAFKVIQEEIERNRKG